MTEFQSYQGIVATRGSSLTPTQRLLYMCVSMRAGSEGKCWASVSTLSEDSGLNARTVRRLLKQLVKTGALGATPSPGRTTVYQVKPASVPTPGAVSPLTHDHPGSDVTPDTVPPHPGPSVTPPRTLCHPTPDTGGEGVGPCAPQSVLDPPRIRPEIRPEKKRAGKSPPPSDEQIRLWVADLMEHQESDEPQHGMNQPKDIDALRRALHRFSFEQLETLWFWSGLSSDSDAEACRAGNWRRWSSLLKGMRGDDRLLQAEAWHERGRPTGDARREQPRHIGSQLLADFLSTPLPTSDTPDRRPRGHS